MNMLTVHWIDALVVSHRIDKVVNITISYSAR